MVLSSDSDSHFDILKTLRENRVNDLVWELFVSKWLIIVRNLGGSHCLKMLSTDEIVVNHWLDKRSFNLVKINVMLHALLFVLLEKTCKVPGFIQKEYLDNTFYRNECRQELSHQECILRESFEVPVICLWCIVDYLFPEVIQALNYNFHLLSIFLLENHFPVLKCTSFWNDILLWAIIFENFLKDGLCALEFKILLFHHHEELAGSIVRFLCMKGLELLDSQAYSKIMQSLSYKW